jgi:hypothetical protein
MPGTPIPIVHQNIETAELRGDAVDRGCDVRRPREVECNESPAPAGRFDGAHRLVTVRLRRREVEDGNVGAERRQSRRDGAPDPGGRAGHGDNFSIHAKFVHDRCCTAAESASFTRSPIGQMRRRFYGK